MSAFCPVQLLPDLFRKIFLKEILGCAGSDGFGTSLECDGCNQPTAAFHDRENRRDLWPRLWAAWVYPVLPRATGRIKFSARLWLNSSSGYSSNRVSFLPMH